MSPFIKENRINKTGFYPIVDMVFIYFTLCLKVQDGVKSENNVRIVV